MALASTVLVASPPATAGTIVVDNQSPSPVKVVAPGGSAVVPPGSEPSEIAFDNDEQVGVTVRIWWTSEPRQLCQVFTPWEHRVVVTGKAAIRCRALGQPSVGQPSSGKPS